MIMAYGILGLLIVIVGVALGIFAFRYINKTERSIW